MHAFRCKSCGKLHSADVAAECAHPHACCVCGSGVSFHPKTGVKTAHPENWEVLSEATPERLAELGMEAHHVECHTPWKPGVDQTGPPVNIQVEASDGVGTQDSAAPS